MADEYVRVLRKDLEAIRNIDLNNHVMRVIVAHEHLMAALDDGTLEQRLSEARSEFETWPKSKQDAMRAFVLSKK